MRELSSPRVDQSASCPVRQLAIHELAYPRVVQLPFHIPPPPYATARLLAIPLYIIHNFVDVDRLSCHVIDVIASVLASAYD